MPVRQRVNHTTVVAYLALFTALGGSAYAAGLITGADIKNRSIAAKDLKKNAVNTKKVKNRSLLATDFKLGQLPAGATGPQGSQGGDGAAGPQGPQGSQGAAGQDATAPAGAVMFFNLASCPAGWSELVAAQGRYLVGIPAGGTLGGSSGTPLADREGRPVGQHNHPTTDPTHDHTIRAISGSGSLFGLLYGSGGTTTFAYGTQSDRSDVTVANAGSVAGTNAPYLQLLVCEKNP